MSTMSGGPGWWQGRDGQWYSPEQLPVAVPAPLPVAGVQQAGVVAVTPKSRTTAIVLAVLFGVWTWLYTYRLDGKKFWIGLVGGVVGVLLSLIIVGYFILLGLWIWAIVDAASKPDVYYQQFPNG